MDLNQTIYIGRDDDISDVLRHLLTLADSPAEVVMQVGTREVRVSDAVAERFESAAAGPDLDSVEEPEETEPEPDAEPEEATEPEQQEGTADVPAPRKRAPRKAAAETPAAEETA